MEACLADMPLTKDRIVEAFEQEKMNVEITENKMGNVVVSRMCELYKHQVFTQDIPWDDAVEKAIKDKVSIVVKPTLRKLFSLFINGSPRTSTPTGVCDICYFDRRAVACCRRS